MDVNTTCEACRAGDCDNCQTPDPYGRASGHGGIDPGAGREGWYPMCCCGRVTLGPTTAHGRAALVRARREREAIQAAETAERAEAARKRLRAALDPQTDAERLTVDWLCDHGIDVEPIADMVERARDGAK